MKVIFIVLSGEETDESGSRAHASLKEFIEGGYITVPSFKSKLLGKTVLAATTKSVTV